MFENYRWNTVRVLHLPSIKLREEKKSRKEIIGLGIDELECGGGEGGEGGIAPELSKVEVEIKVRQSSALLECTTAVVT